MREPDEVIDTPVLIIGAGAAGLRTAIELAQRGTDCLVVGRRSHGDAHTRMAAGGINASLGTRDPDDSPAFHFADTIREGHFICDPRAVELLCRDAPARVHELREWGCAFNETDTGEIEQRYFGAQSYRRTCFVGDRTGEAILGALVDRAHEVGVPWRDGVFIVRILVQDGRAVGAIGTDTDTGRTLVFRAAAIVIAAGGATSIYGRSSSRHDENTGDAVALAFQAGATLRDMEFVQFHPTGMVTPPDMRGWLVSEAVRGEGGRLFNAAGERFMERYSPERLELDARDVVARAIAAEIREGRGTEAGAVLLDASHLERAFIEERLPKFARQFRDLGVDVTTDAVEVAPTAHYAMGGIVVDFTTGATGVDGLFAVGEATGGVHGANRLGGNSLAETVVFGRITGAHLADYVQTRRPRTTDVAIGDALATPDRAHGSSDEQDVESIFDELGTLLWQHAGIVRSATGLREAIEQLADLRDRAARARPDPADHHAAIRIRTLHFTLCTADILLHSALLRDESRGAHFREDAPDSRDAWRRTVLARRTDNGAPHLWTQPIPPIPPELESALDKAPEPQYHHTE